MTTKDILFQHRARAQIGAGVDALADVVKVTLGPAGRHVLLDRAFGSPTVTKDGVTVAAEVELNNRFANLGAQMVREVASQTSEVAGDGTTTAIVLAQAIYREGLKLVAAGANPMDLKRGVDAAVEEVVADLARRARPTKGRNEIAQVGAISANGDQAIGDLIAEAMERVGKEGVVTVEEGTSMETTLEVVEGMQIDRGYLSPYFVTDPARMEAVLEEPFLLVCDRKISSMEQLLPLLEQVVAAQKPLLIVAEDVEAEALATLVVNRLRGSLKVCAVKGPGFGDLRRDVLEDIAVLTGTRVVSDELGQKLDDLALTDLGRLRSATIDKDHTTLVGGVGSKASIAARVKLLQRQLEDATSDRTRERIQTRLAKLAGGVAILTLGAATETELAEKKARVEDALHATRAAVEEGVVPGGGVALLRAIPALDALKLGGDRKLGLNLIRRAIEEPLRQMARNAGLEGAVVVARVREAEGAHGYNVASGKYEDLMAAGVIDPTKVVRVALQNAASVAALMLATEALIITRRSPTSSEDDE